MAAHTVPDDEQGLVEIAEESILVQPPDWARVGRAVCRDHLLGISERVWLERVGNHTMGRTDRAGGLAVRGRPRQAPATLVDNVLRFYAFCRFSKENRWLLASSC
jgi:hypothetical protein